MGKVIAGTTMSLDGFMNDRDRNIAALYGDFQELRAAPSFQEIIRQTGAVVMGRRTFAMGDPDLYAQNYEFQVPIFVVTHSIPDRHPQESDTLKFTFVTDGIESAISQAKEAAGGRDVQLVGGASTIKQALNAGLCDELHIDIIPVLLGDGLRLFEGIDMDRVRLERLKVEELTSTRTSITFRVIE